MKTFFLFCSLQIITSWNNDDVKLIPNKSEIQLGNIEWSISKSGNFLATLCEDGTISVWNVEKQDRIIQCRPFKYLKLIAKGDTVYLGTEAEAICFHPNQDEIIYFSTYQGIQEWQWGKGITPKTIYSELGRMSSKLICSENSEWLSSIDRYGNVWCARLKALREPVVYRSGRSLPDQWKNHLFFSPNSSEIIFHDNNHIKSLSIGSGKATVEDLGKLNTESPIDTLARDQTGKSIVVGNQIGEVYLMDTATKKIELFSKGHDYTPIASFSPDGKLVVIGDGKGIISIFEIKSKLKLFQTEGPKSGVTGVGFLHDNKTVFAIGEYRHVRYWKMEHNELKEITKEPNP